MNSLPELLQADTRLATELLLEIKHVEVETPDWKR